MGVQSFSPASLIVLFEMDLENFAAVGGAKKWGLESVSVFMPATIGEREKKMLCTLK